MLFAAIFLSFPGFLLSCSTYAPGQEREETLSVVMDQLPAEFAHGNAPGVAGSNNAVVQKIQSAVNRARVTVTGRNHKSSREISCCGSSVPWNAATASVSYSGLHCAGTISTRKQQGDEKCAAGGTCCEVSNGIVTGIMSPGAEKTSSVPSQYKRGQIDVKIASVEMSTRLNGNAWANMVRNVATRLRNKGGGFSHIRLNW